MTDHRAATVATLQRAFGDLVGGATTVVAALGDRLGLWRALAGAGPSTAVEVAARAGGLAVRPVAEWLAMMAAAGHLDHHGDGPDATFTLAPGPAEVFASDATPYAMGGALQNLLGALAALDDVTESFRTGTGIAPARYRPDVFDGMARTTATAHEHVLVPRWLPMVADVHNRLAAGGARVVDIGCGQGRAAMAIAAGYPGVEVVGVDAHPPVVAAATERAAAAGLADRVHFAVAAVGTDGVAVPDGPFDVALLLDVVHDAGDPVALLAAARAALTADGALLVLEPASAPTIAGNATPFGLLNYFNGLMYCMPVSLAAGGPGLGANGTPPAVLEALCLDAGFTSVVEVAIDNPFNRLYAVTP